MQASIIYIFGVAVLIALAVLALFIWGAHTGGFDKTEDAKYVLFRDEQDDDDDEKDERGHASGAPRHLP